MFDDILVKKKRYFNGEYLTIPDSGDFSLGDKDFTLMFYQKEVDGEWKWVIEEIKCGCVGVVFED